ncbi:MAG: ParB N-terminal domain-containing protein [Mycobacterium sp.]|jgi:ParB family chromosome partitioning protein|nr:ParB N-terminal domain-containing protein [Mycobacterium sp.]
MARGKRTDLASLTAAVGEHSPVEQASAGPPPRTAPLADLTANPRNPREGVGDLSALASIVDIQLQPVTVVSRAAYLALYPDDEIEARWVVINGCRRLAAAHEYGRAELDISVNDAVARDRVTLISAAIAENVDRQDFDVIEEAKAVQALVDECGRADHAAERLHRTGAWVSQRLALLKLAPELQAALRRGELAIREARTLVRVPLEEQVLRWQAALDRKQEDKKPTAPPRPSPSRSISRALSRFDKEPKLLADALREQLGESGVATLRDLLGADQMAGLS